LKNLQKIGFLTIQSTNRYSIGTVLNYDTYQNPDLRSNQQENTTPTNHQPPSNQPAATPNKLKNFIKIKMENQSEINEDRNFQNLWDAYPRKENMKMAYDAWLRLPNRIQMLHELLAAIERQKTSVRWQEDDGKYIPQLGNWLSHERWKDEIVENNNNIKDLKEWRRQI
jgi:hypothetical protein